jgi:hypothetical protein
VSKFAYFLFINKKKVLKIKLHNLLNLPPEGHFLLHIYFEVDVDSDRSAVVIGLLRKELQELIKNIYYYYYFKF